MTEAHSEPGGFQSVEDELGGPDEQRPADRPVEAAEGSVLSSLRARRRKSVENLHFDLEVPRYDPPVYVRFKPVSQQKVEDTYRRTEKRKGQDRTVVTNAIILAEACLGVFEVIDGREVSVDPDDRDGEWPKFDERLGKLLTSIEDGERPPSRASDVVRKLYLTDGDIISTSQDLSYRSGYAQEQLEKDPEGN